MHSHCSSTRTTNRIWRKHWHKHALRNAPRSLLRSEVNRFTEFCNSQWLLHFAAPFINMQTKTSVADIINVMHCINCNQHSGDQHVSRITATAPRSTASAPRSPVANSTLTPYQCKSHMSHLGVHYTNGPPAGSPTETLLRLLLPLSDKVH